MLVTNQKTIIVQYLFQHFGGTYELPERREDDAYAKQLNRETHHKQVLHSFLGHLPHLLLWQKMNNPSKLSFNF